MTPEHQSAGLTPAWDPAKYLEFAGPRLRPALDLLARVPLPAPAAVHDLGCGAGNVTRLLAERWPAAHVTGIDGSAAMLETARAAAPGVTWVEADLATWRPPRPADLLFSNAALHWLDDHRALFPRLVADLAAGGVLAVQMPRNHGAPSHTEMVAAAEAGPWRERLRPALRARPVAEPAVYHDILAPHVSRLDIWETEYLHVLEGPNPVVEWTRGSALKPLLDRLQEPERSGFLADYSTRIARAYPARPDGRTLFPFRRLFIVAVR
ncbi:MAG TPA: trans-aconitate 2-methyltransferase [Methylomirabilota bacterium]